MKKINESVKCVIMLMMVFIMMTNSNAAKAGALKGIELSLGIIIPSLLPILIITSTISKSYSKNIINKIFSPIIRHVFHLPVTAASPIFFGLIGGYPSGAVLTKNAYDNGLITKEEAQRIMYFNVCPGIAFTINAVGSLYNDNGRTGAIIYIICLASSLIIGAFQGIFYKHFNNTKTNMAYTGLGESFIEAINETKDNLTMMSCYIIFFSSIANLFGIPDIINPFVEITNGIFSSKNPVSLEYICLFLGFGGFCIHFQIMGIVKSFDMKYYKLLLSRIISALLCYFPGKAYTLICSSETEVFSNISYTVPKESEFGKGLGMILLFGSVIIICDIKNKKSKLL